MVIRTAFIKTFTVSCLAAGKVFHDPAYEPLEKVLDLIHEAGGVAVLAHPSVYQSMELAEELASEGRIDGVEIDHPRNTPRGSAGAARAGGALESDRDRRNGLHGMHMSKPTPLGALTTQR